VHEYTSPIAEEESVNLLRYIAAHLRLIAPDLTDANQNLRVNLRPNGSFEATGASFPHDRIFLLDCEFLTEGITEAALTTLRQWMPWIVRMSGNGRRYFPLNLALSLSEKAYRELDGRIRILFRVMALEALFSTGTAYGLNALQRIPKLIGRNSDLYDQYSSTMQTLPKLTAGTVLSDLAKFRNKIAHGNKTPKAWLKDTRRMGGDHRLSHGDELAEAASALVALSWKTIINDGLQDTFTNKLKMRRYLSQSKSARQRRRNSP
jgi:hypothetical protein